MAVGLYLLDICQDSYFHRKYYVSFFGPGKKMKIFLCSANFVLTPHNYPDWQSQRKRRLLVLKSLCDGIFTENVTCNIQFLIIPEEVLLHYQILKCIFFKANKQQTRFNLLLNLYYLIYRSCSHFSSEFNLWHFVPVLCRRISLLIKIPRTKCRFEIKRMKTHLSQRCWE